MEEGLIKKLLTSMKCDSCGQHYAECNIDVLGHNGDTWFFRVLCAACHSQCLVAAVIRSEKVAEVITDLTEAELEKFRDNVIEADDVLNVYNFLKDFDGDFARLFGRK